MHSGQVVGLLQGAYVPKASVPEEESVRHLCHRSLGI